MNLIIKPGYFIGTLITIFLVAESLFMHGDLTTKAIIKTCIPALGAGAFAGFLVEWGLGIFKKLMQSNVGESKFLKELQMVHLDPDENIIFQTGANHIKAWEAVGGKLYLTNKKLIFKPHSINFQKQELIIPYSEIKDIVKFKVFWRSNNGMSVQTKDLRKEKLALEDIEECFVLLSETMESILKT